MYAPHPAFAKDANGDYVYHAMKREDVADKYKITDFKQTGTRELTADDYVYGIRRLATPRIKSPSFSTMSDYIVGLKEYGDKIVETDKSLRRDLAPTDRDLPMLDFRKYPFAGAEALDKHTLRIRVKGKYPAVQVLAGNDVLLADPVGGRKVLLAARHGREEPDDELLAGRHRAVHAHRLRGEPPPRAGAQPQFPRRDLPVRRRARRQGEGLPRRLRQAVAVRRQGRVRHGEGSGSAAGEVPAGLLRHAGDRTPRLRHGLHRLRWATTRARKRNSARRESNCLPPSRPTTGTWASTGWTRSSARARRRNRPSATASCARRWPSRSTGRNTSRSSNVARALPRRGRCRHRCSATATMDLRLSTRSCTGRDPTANRCGARLTRRRSCSPRPAIRTAATR